MRLHVILLATSVLLFMASAFLLGYTAHDDIRWKLFGVINIQTVQSQMPIGWRRCRRYVEEPKSNLGMWDMWTAKTEIEQRELSRCYDES
jgi:hypothetical protein